MQTSVQVKAKLFDYLALLQTLKNLEQYQTFCYNLYLLATYYTNKPHTLKSGYNKISYQTRQELGTFT